MKPTLIALLAAIALLFRGISAHAAPDQSLLPVFGTEGEDFKKDAKDNHVIQGWLPTGWEDNSDWAAVEVTYRKLDDGPNKSVGAVRIKLEKTAEPWVQFTSFTGLRTYARGRIYRVAGWLRSPDQVTISVCARQEGDPYENYHQQALVTEPAWKQFEFEFTPKKDIEAVIMFIIESVATVDLAGIVVTDEGPVQ